MAIQVAGTEVLSNARSLNNITAVDSTTVIDAGFGGGPVVAGHTYEVQGISQI